MNSYYLGFDTSAYTTSIAIIDENLNLIYDVRKLLEVPMGKRGLRQQEAIFQHINNVPELIGKISKEFDLTKIKAVAASIKPRMIESSYMPVFKVSQGQAYIISKTLNIPYKEFSHQDGHIASAIYGCKMEGLEKFIVLHISGGTTELLLVEDNKIGYGVNIIGGTKDISAGQLIDRMGVAMGLRFPSGMDMENMAKKGKEIKGSPVSTSNTWINYSGTETYFQRLIVSKMYSSEDIAKSIFVSIGISLKNILLQAIATFNVKDIVVVGGVASNQIIKDILNDYICFHNIARVHIPNPKFCTDNAIGIAYLSIVKKGYNYL